MRCILFTIQEVGVMLVMNTNNSGIMPVDWWFLVLNLGAVCETSGHCLRCMFVCVCVCVQY